MRLREIEEGARQLSQRLGEIAVGRGWNEMAQKERFWKTLRNCRLE